MKIRVTSERECCRADEDLQTYRGVSISPKVESLRFCKYCGQLWHLKRFADAAGDIDSEYVMFIPGQT